MGMKNDGVRSIPQSISMKSQAIAEIPVLRCSKAWVKTADCVKRLYRNRHVIGCEKFYILGTRVVMRIDDIDYELACFGIRIRGQGVYRSAAHENIC